MRRTATSIRCVPRYGFENTEVRTIDVDLSPDADEREMLQRIQVWFAKHGVSDAVYDIAVDDDGFFAVINDEAFEEEWGTALL